MKLELSAEHLQALGELLERHVPHAEVWAYGSRVTGASHDGSDLDLVLRAPTPVTSKILADLRSALRESSLPFTVEVRDWHSLPAEFYSEIEREHNVLKRPH